MSGASELELAHDSMIEAGADDLEWTDCDRCCGADFKLLWDAYPLAVALLPIHERGCPRSPGAPVGHVCLAGLVGRVEAMHLEISFARPAAEGGER